MNNRALKEASGWFKAIIKAGFVIGAALCVTVVIGAVVTLAPMRSAYYELKSRSAPGEYSRCCICGFWYSNKDMTNGMCDDCLSRLPIKHKHWKGWK